MVGGVGGGLVKEQVWDLPEMAKKAVSDDGGSWRWFSGCPTMVGGVGGGLVISGVPEPEPEEGSPMAKRNR
ncbi:hypothetical protein V498_01642 [Pseudogymnoascus sp. VKM F-4517 (FW-2822)]|nr:hypothetical protein V498_01642 [Pseudogymnoascus sp. VKM F-4517 (FW-2822)]